MADEALREILTGAVLNLDNYTREVADHTVLAFEESVLEASDHTAYRELADAVNGQIGHLSGDADNWDGEDSELGILCSWLELSGEWLPGMYSHLTAERIRIAFRDGSFPDGSVLGLAEGMANVIDPWKQITEGPRWGWLVRKSDDVAVPWQFVSAATLIIQNEKERSKIDG